MSSPETTKRKHPHFDDRGTLDWYTSFAEAQAAAQSDGRRLFIEIGRQLCSGCSTLVQAVIPRPDIAPLLRQHYVALAGDADLPEAEVHRLMFKLRTVSMLPVVLIADANGQFLEGLSGVYDPPRIKALLEKHAAGRESPAK
jgi:thioredoxin-related protein